MGEDNHDMCIHEPRRFFSGLFYVWLVLWGLLSFTQEALKLNKSVEAIGETRRHNVSFKTQLIVKTAILSVIAYLLMLVEIPVVFFFPDFLRIDASDVPAILGGFAIGPVAGVAIELVKNLIKFATGSYSGGIGELANFIIGTAWVLPASLLYRRNKTKRTALLGMVLGVVTMLVIGGLVNYFVLIPLYLPSADAKSLVLYAIMPFNLFKGIVITVITLLIYKKLSPLIHG